MKRVSKFLLGMILCVAMLAAFTPLAPDGIAGALAPETAYAEDGDYSLVCGDGNNDLALYYYEINPGYPTEYSNGDTFTVTDHGVETVFTYNFNNFYDENEQNMKEHGYALAYEWLEDYDLYGDDDPFDHIGRVYSFVYFIYKVNAEGKPVDEDGNPVDSYWDAEILAVSDFINLTSTSDHIETTIDGVVYFAEYDKYPGSVIIMTEKEHKGALTIPSKVTIEGKEYPVILISGNSFLGQTGITSVKLPKTLNEIGSKAFLNTGLKKVEIPASVKEIGEFAFGYNATINYETMEVTFSKVPGFTIFTPSGSAADDYAYDNGFSLFTEKTAKAMKTKAKCKSLKKRKVRVTWTKKKYATGYQVFKSNKKNGKYRKVGTIKKNTTVKWTSKKLTKALKGRTIYYKVRPYTKFFGKTYYGKMSNAAAVKVR